MKRKVLDYPNPHRSDDYSLNAKPRMNSEKQGRYRNQRSHVDKRQHYYPHRRHEEEYSWNAQPRMNSKKQRRYHNERSNDEKRYHYYPHRRHEESRLNYDPYYDGHGHDHSICLLVRKQRKERRPDIYSHLFVTEEERALMPLPSPSNKRELDNDDIDDYQPILNEDDFPVLDDDRFTESLQKLADYWGKAYEKARQRESENIIDLLDLNYQF